MSIQITQDNLSKFNKRLHKALKDVMGDKVSLSQAAELFARAAGFQTLHDLQNHLGGTPDNTSVTSVSKRQWRWPRAAPATSAPAMPPKCMAMARRKAWIQLINADIRKYVDTHPTSNIRHWTWAKHDQSYSLNIEGDDASFGLFFGENVLSYVHKELEHLNATEDDQNFIFNLACRFPKDPIEAKKLGLSVAQVCKLPFMRDGFYSIVRAKKYTTAPGNFPKYKMIANFGEALQKFAVVPSKDFEAIAAFSNNQKQYVDITGLKIAPENTFDTWSKAVACLQKNPEMLLVQLLIQTSGNKVWSGFCATASQYSADVKSVNGDERHFAMEYCSDGYDVARCQGFLAAVSKLTSDHNPYGCNEVENQLWDDGFKFAQTYPLRQQFWIKPPR